MPIISSSYASTKIQGGNNEPQKVDEGQQRPEQQDQENEQEGAIKMKANVIEQAQVEEITQ